MAHRGWRCPELGPLARYRQGAARGCRQAYGGRHAVRGSRADRARTHFGCVMIPWLKSVPDSTPAPSFAEACPKFRRTGNAPIGANDREILAAIERGELVPDNAAAESYAGALRWRLAN